jgi:hypothetical protein
MFKPYLKVDEWVKSLIQNTYLWLLDRTGIYVATLMFAAYVPAPGVAIIRGHDQIFNGIFIAIVGIALAYPYILQDKGDNEAFNATAMWAENSVLRHVLIFLQISLVVSTMISLDIIGFVICTLQLVYLYLWTVKIRDRDKKPFFEQAPKLAMERGS